MAKKTEKELEIQRLDKKTPLQMFRDYVMITVASFIYAVSVLSLIHISEPTRH